MEKWSVLRKIISNKDMRNRTYKDAAALVGIITWHWSVKAGTREELGMSMKVNQLLGHLNMEKKEEWMRQAQTISASMWEGLFAQVDSIIAGNAKAFVRPMKEYGRFNYVKYAASDSTSLLTAGIDLDVETPSPADGLWTRIIVKVNQHITRKESWAAIWLLEHMLERCDPGTLCVVGLDNVAAVSVLNKRHCSFDEPIDTRIKSLQEQFNKKKCSWKAIYIPGEQEPADEPTRNLPLKLEKCKEARAYLEKAATTWYETVEANRRKERKRQREEEEARERDAEKESSK